MPAASFLVLRAGKLAHSYLSFRRSMMTWLSGPHLTLGWVESRILIRVVPDLGTPPIKRIEEFLVNTLPSLSTW